jgi:hypothetical protein
VKNNEGRNGLKRLGLIDNTVLVEQKIGSVCLLKKVALE